jgi:NitT/TauT family transport system permease protein
MIAILKKIWPVVLFCAIWEGACVWLKIPNYIVPPPHRVLERIVESWSLLCNHSLVSILEIMAGFALAAIGGILCAIAMVHSQRIEAGLGTA